MAPVLLICLAVLALAALLRQPIATALRRGRLRRRPFPAEWRQILRRRVPYFQQLPADLQLQLKRHILVFLAEKPFIGCGGLVVTDEMRVTIAAQACLLILNRRNHYFPSLRQILLYPGAFVVERVQADGNGLQQEQRRALSGESWVQGQVILSWDDVLRGAADAHDGHNVVLHEFAHQLDQEKGVANGAPPVAGRARRARWAQVLSADFARLQAAVARAEPTLLDAYGATDPAEFFAVASETFFERPAELARWHPALFRELGLFYRVNPLSW
ncbi:M90 family metallopeptidase [Xylophilus sp. GW821-FHT01B05]